MMRKVAEDERQADRAEREIAGRYEAVQRRLPDCNRASRKAHQNCDGDQHGGEPRRRRNAFKAALRRARRRAARPLPIGVLTSRRRFA